MSAEAEFRLPSLGAEVPQLNGRWTVGAFVPAEWVNLGVAVAQRTGGLVAPAIQEADTLAVDDLMGTLRDVVRPRAGRLRGSEMTDGTLTVTNPATGAWKRCAAPSTRRRCAGRVRPGGAAAVGRRGRAHRPAGRHL